VPLTPVGMSEALDRIAGWAGAAPFRLVVTPNVDHIVTLQRNPDFQQAYDRCALSLADGVPLLWAARYLGLPPLEKVSGSDLLPELCRRAAAEGRSVFFAGGRSPDDLAGALQIVRARFPGLDAAGHCPPFGFERDPAATDALLAAIAEFQPDLLLLACGAPKSEIWMDRHRDRLARGVGIGIGAGLDFLTGRDRRAPRWMQRYGLEWLWRLARSPRRLAKRYLWNDLRFFPLVWRWKRTQQ
jgi:N-acetylglucosaminyldiphosphoundecaprenol N-acetyl-beta-D-mannosaminyltransferase